MAAVLEQKVTGMQARRSWRTLLQWYGEPAPGPVPPGMRDLPEAATWAAIPSWDWHRAGVDGKRSRTILAAVSAAERLEESVDLTQDAAEHGSEPFPVSALDRRGSDATCSRMCGRRVGRRLSISPVKSCTR